MWRQWSLRFRVFLFFAFLTCAGLLGIAGGLYFGARQLVHPDDLQALLIAGMVAAFVVLGINAWVWMLFDENVARPVEALSTDLRARAHCGLDHDLDAEHARYLGDLAPAATQMAAHLAASRGALAEAVAKETATLTQEAGQLQSLIAEMPVAVILLNAEGRIALYNRAARQLLSVEDGLALGARIETCLAPHAAAAVRQALGKAAQDPITLDGALPRRDGVTAHARAYGNGRSAPACLLTLETTATPEDTGAGEAHYDLDIVARPRSGLLTDLPLAAAPFVVFDTETTGLDPSNGDEIVQIAAVRVLNGRLLDGERFEMLVNPGRRIPSVATGVHGITEEMVADAADVPKALTRFHRFCHGSVIVAHNAPFDMAFLTRREAEIGARFDHALLDTVLLSALIWGRSGTDHTLDALAERLDVVIPPAARHTAHGDAMATALVLTRLIPLLGTRHIATVEDAIAASSRHQSMMATG
ncbi:MAG: exonuclease domain-containing protein [Pseudomonadota bacterium]